MFFKTFSMRILVPIASILLSSVLNLGHAGSEEQKRMSTMLDTAENMVSEVGIWIKSENVSCPTKDNFRIQRPYDCSDLHRSGFNESGVYTIWPFNRLTAVKGVRVYCDMDNGGWTVIQRRGDFGRANDYFNQTWEMYKNGFGDIENDFWLGNDNIFVLTNQRPYSVYFDLGDKQNNTAYAQYENFWIDDEFNNYTLHISGYSGTAGDAMIYHDTMKFSTIDRDNDKRSDENCAVRDKGGWWFRSCAKAILNGEYKHPTHGNFWYPWTKNYGYLPRTEIKIKPSIF